MTPDPIGPNVELLEQLLHFLSGLTDAQYRHVEARLSTASIGAHVRHVLDHYRLFLAGLPAGLVDYDDRERETDVERERAAALHAGRAAVAGLRALPPDVATRPLRVRQQGSYEPGRFDGCASRADRELLFLQSHTTHHQALIALLARAQGLTPPPLFGIAPSTAAWMAARDGALAPG
jgi:uncharacterized damage-inducible protein DinB